MSDDSRWMGAALALAERGRARTGSNPNVGSVIVADGRVVGRGWTQPDGRPHAEAMALDEAGEAALGATLYVTLEPCAHASPRGPTCASLIVERGIARVVAAVTDPDPRTAGAGFAALARAGVAVTKSFRAAEARCAAAGFFTRQALARPFVTLKLATSIDGRIAMADGSSRWITGDAARAHAHLERARHDAILVGRGTLEADMPRLDVRLAGLEDHSPNRYLLSRTLEAPDGWGAIVDPSAIGSLPANWLLVEGGAETAAAFLAQDLVDRLLIYRAPILIGAGKAALGDIGLVNLTAAHGRWHLADARMLGTDRLDIYERTREDKACSPA